MQRCWDYICLLYLVHWDSGSFLTSHFETHISLILCILFCNFFLRNKSATKEARKILASVLYSRGPTWYLLYNFTFTCFPSRVRNVNLRYYAPRERCAVKTNRSENSLKSYSSLSGRLPSNLKNNNSISV